MGVSQLTYAPLDDGTQFRRGTGSVPGGVRRVLISRCDHGFIEAQPTDIAGFTPEASSPAPAA
ncbi:hypothetical protein GCM10009637_01010 [Brevibacterium luteolum]